jgi:histidinol-phosphate aminotransferase
MSNRYSRRNWLKSSLILGAGTALAPAALGGSGYNKFTGEYESELELNGLKARLNSNENPYGPSAKAQEAFKNAVGEGNLYPFAYSREVKEIIAKEEGVSADHIFIGAGSSAILTMTGLAYGVEKGAIMSAFPTFRTMLDTAVNIGCDWQQIPLDKDQKHDLPAMLNGIDSKTKLVYVCNPNNPTGTVVDTDELKRFCSTVVENKKIPVFVDEAYTDFMDNPKAVTVIDRIHRGEDVIIARTFSKIHGMAGFRIGYGIAQPETVKKITTYGTRLVPVSGPSLHAAMASFKDTPFMDMVKKKNAGARDFTFNELKKLGFTPAASNTSFMIFPIAMEPGDYLDAMQAEGVAVRSWVFDDKNWCRVSIGTLEEMKIFIDTLKTVHKS